MILPIADDDTAPTGDGQPLEAFELAVSGTPSAERLQEGAVRLEDLDPVVAAVTHDDVPLVVDGHPLRELELAIVRPFRAEGGEAATVHVKDLDPVVVGVRHHHAVGVGHRNEVRVLELTWTTAHAAELADEGAVGLEHLGKTQRGNNQNAENELIAEFQSLSLFLIKDICLDLNC
ncbi:hypothetical protein AVEN_72329-1 [Araneus ventricosus]|uniref:Uncharacterized protein n=1 Tax=Araneus ventricosus TaxID=182803 RepID=A0A4Y2JM92_ARAVE|nr:hypothetical protein AVEN_72329-1 [Araneus ventricosus]